MAPKGKGKTQTAATGGESSSSDVITTKHKNLTQTNLDSTCNDMNKGLVARLGYQLTLLTALNPKAMDPLECFVVFGLLFVFWTCFTLYVHAFASGIRDGFAEAMN